MFLSNSSSWWLDTQDWRLALFSSLTSSFLLSLSAQWVHPFPVSSLILLSDLCAYPHLLILSLSMVCSDVMTLPHCCLILSFILLCCCCSGCMHQSLASSRPDQGRDQPARLDQQKGQSQSEIEDHFVIGPLWGRRSLSVDDKITDSVMTEYGSIMNNKDTTQWLC